jgi:hypothetical protein
MTISQVSEQLGRVKNDVCPLLPRKRSAQGLVKWPSMLRSW